MPIKRLPSGLAARIAAGEVVERPVSVVKELVENSLDAGAKRIKITLQDGGKRLISVTDDGHGIAADELHLAFTRFATSKIEKDTDIENIKTLGFRGEALPSIAAISELQMVTNDGSTSVVYKTRFGKELKTKPVGAPKGTSVEVENLFQNTPARLKFMSSNATETVQVTQAVINLAVAHPEVAFLLIANDRDVFRSLGDNNLKTLSSAIFGLDVANQMIYIEPSSELEKEEFELKGAISPTHIKRTTRKQIYFAVNKRPVTNRVLYGALINAYRPFMKDREYPLSILSLTIPTFDVDVNVHPAKLEVGFLRESLVYNVVHKEISRALARELPKLGLNAYPKYDQKKTNYYTHGRTSEGATGYTTNENKRNDQNPVSYESMGEKRGLNSPPFSNPFGGESNSLNNQPSTPNADIDTSLELLKEEGDFKSKLSGLYVKGQSMLTYIVCENIEGIYLIDMHAAHERIVYQNLKTKFEKRKLVTQPLLTPEIVKLSPTSYLTLEKLGVEKLSKLGFEVDFFGVNELAVRAVPIEFVTLFRKVDIGTVFEDVLKDDITENVSENWYENSLKTMACHSSLRAGMPLNLDESKRLIKKLSLTENPQTCPHGRPTTLSFLKDSIDRHFERC